MKYGQADRGLIVLPDISVMSKGELVEYLAETENEITEIQKYMRAFCPTSPVTFYHLRDRRERRDAIKKKLEEFDT